MPNTDQITHTFSVEWEIAFKSGVSKATLIDALAAAGLSFVKVVTDCSIPIASSYHSGLEIVFPPMTDTPETWDIYQRVSDILEQYRPYDPNTLPDNPRHNSNSAGMHVHVSAAAINVEDSLFNTASCQSLARSRNYLAGREWFHPIMTALSVKDIVSRYYINRDIIGAMLPWSRRHTTYAKNITARQHHAIQNLDAGCTVEDIRAHIGQGKYYTVNLQCFNAYKTIEFRQGQCTWNVEKTREWVRLLLGLVYSTRQGRVIEGRNQTIVTPSNGREIFAAQAHRAVMQYDLMRSTEGGATTRQIIAAMGGNDGDVRRRVSELRDRIGAAAIVTHTQQANGATYGDGTDHTRYEVLHEYTEDRPCEMVPENRRLPETIYANMTDAQFDYWQERILEIRARDERNGLDNPFLP